MAGYGDEGTSETLVSVYVTLDMIGESENSGSGNRGKIGPTSNRAFNKVNGLSRNPTETRAVAPARRFPPLVSLGSIDKFESRPDRWWTGAKYGDVAMTVRSCVRLVRYSATPGTFLRE